ncbi:type 2 periplasmic-binding domain-containing protein [Virgibacillus ainsalahensis]
MINFKNVIFILVLIALPIVLTACKPKPVDEEASAESSGNIYNGGEMEVLVPYGAGGGTDVFARFIAPYLSDHTEGNPDLQVLNVPGGQSITGTNEYVNMKEANGLNALTTSASTHTPFLLGHSAVQYDLNELEPIVGFPTGGVVYSTPEIADDIQNNSEPLVYAGISATGLDLVTLLSFEVLGIDVQANMGYEGRGPSRVSFEQGESNIDYQTTSAYKSNVEPLIEQGSAKPIYSFGQMKNGEIVRDPAFPDLPTVKEIYVELHGEEPSGVEWEAYKAFLTSSFTIQKVLWLHGDAPDQAKETLKVGAQEMIAEPSFMEEGEDVLGGYEPYTTEELDHAINDMLNVSGEVTGWVTEFLKEEYGVTIE